MSTVPQDGGYTIVPVLRTPSVSPSETVKIDIYIVGSGDIEDNRLDIAHVNPRVISEDFGTIKMALLKDPEGGIKTGKETNCYDSQRTNFNLNDTGGKFSFPQEYFSRSLDDEHPTLHFDTTLLETKHDEMPPIQYQLETASWATPGDYSLMMVFTYDDGSGNIFRDIKDVTFHVDSFRERWKPYPTVAGILAAFFALISLILTALSVTLNALSAPP